MLPTPLPSAVRGSSAVYCAKDIKIPDTTVHAATGSMRRNVSHNKLFHADEHTCCMDDIDPDTMMVAAGVVLSFIALLGIYPLWRDAQE